MHCKPLMIILVCAARVMVSNYIQFSANFRKLVSI